jgi:hypothetical protein
VSLADDRWFAKWFPHAAARAAADRAIDALPVTATMATFLDAWVAAYVAAGGRTKLVLA